MDQEKNNTKRREWEQVTEKERYKIEALRKAKHSIKEISTQLGRDRRTIQREIARGKTEQVDTYWREYRVYLADVGQRKRDERAANKGRSLKIGHNHELARYLEQKIVLEKFSPDAALGELKKTPKAAMANICTSTLYSYIDKGIFVGLSNNDLPVKRNRKQHPHHPIHRVARNHTKGQSIEERDISIDLRLEEGHWEMDCVVGKQGTKACILALTERKQAVELLFKLESKSQECVLAVLDMLEKKHGHKFSQVFQTITVDNGSEFLCAEDFERSKQGYCGKRTRIFYAHPYSAWERGSNENQNKLIRRFVPKGTNIEELRDEDVQRIQHWMNAYPRKRFGYQSPQQRSSLCLQ